MDLNSRILLLTSSALAHGRINIRTCGKDFFPAGAFGTSSRVKGCGSKLCLRVKGLPAPILTDIPTDVSGRPRWFFRERAWVKPFVRINRLSAGAKLLIHRISATEYEIVPTNGEQKTTNMSKMLPGMDDILSSNNNGSNEHVRGRRGKNGDLNKLSSEDRPVHDWYRFVLSYPPHLVRDYLRKFGLSRNQSVLDPFCGTGTTLVECQKQGIPSIGVEANELACFACRIKTDWRPDPDGLMRHARKVAEAAFKRLKADGIEDNPTLVANHKRVKQLRTIDSNLMDLLLTDSISPLPLHKTLVLLEAMEEKTSSSYSGHERIALAKALVYLISNLHFGPEVGIGPAKGDVPVVSAWLSCVRGITKDLSLVRGTRYAQASIHHADARNLGCLIEPESIDAVITSPPYPNEKDYTRTTRLESVLLGFIHNKAELQALKRSMVRSNTRGVYKGDDDDQWITQHPEIGEIAEAIEQRRLELGKTSGFERLYPRVTKLYFGGMARHLSEMTRLLRPGAQLAYVVGDQASYLRIMIRTGELLGKIGQSLGYELLGRDLFRTRLATATRQQLREEVVLFRWPYKSNRRRTKNVKRK